MVNCRNDDYQYVPPDCQEPGLDLRGGYVEGNSPFQVTLQIRASPHYGDQAADQYCIDWGDGAQGGGYLVGGEASVSHVYQYAYNGDYQCLAFPVVVTVRTPCGAVKSRRFGAFILACDPAYQIPGGCVPGDSYCGGNSGPTTYVFNDTGLPDSPSQWDRYVRCKELSQGIPQNLTDTDLDCTPWGGPVFHYGPGGLPGYTTSFLCNSNRVWVEGGTACGGSNGSSSICTPGQYACNNSGTLSYYCAPGGYWEEDPTGQGCQQTGCADCIPARCGPDGHWVNCIGNTCQKTSGLCTYVPPETGLIPQWLLDLLKNPTYLAVGAVGAVGIVALVALATRRPPQYPGYPGYR